MMRRSWLTGVQKPLSQMLPTAHSESTAHADPTGAGDGVAPRAGSASRTTPTRTSGFIPAASRAERGEVPPARLCRAGCPKSRRHLPFAVLEHEADLGGLYVLALRALHFQSRGRARDLRTLDLELHALNFLLHLLQLVAGGADLRRQH